MRPVDKLTEAELLSATSPEAIFTDDADTMKREWRALVKIWHPDQNPKANRDVMTHVNKLYDVGCEKLKLGIWFNPYALRIKATNGKEYDLKFKKHRTFELGDVYIGVKQVSYLLDKSPAAAALVENMKQTVASFKFKDAKMEEHARKFLPKILASVETADKLVVVLAKEPDMILLRDVIEHKGGKLDPVQAAWIITRFYNVGSYLDIMKLTHNDLSPDSMFVSPDHKSLVTGWWYATPRGQKMRYASSRTVLYSPIDVTTYKDANHRIDGELIKATGRELFGDPAGSALNFDPKIPRPLKEWATSPSSDNIVEEFKKWQETILNSFGKRRYVELDAKFSDIYP